jgi:hypothetical protein
MRLKDRVQDKAHFYDDAFFAGFKDSAIQSAEQVLPVVFNWTGQPGSICDVGCGLGTWLYVARQLGVEDVLGLDGSWVDRQKLLIPTGCFEYLDLEQPASLDRRFELALCLEVAEHIPASASERFIEFLTGLADVILFSAAVPGQGGLHHLNEQWPEYWHEKFNRRGYQALDAIRPVIWRNEKISFWYRQNLFLYVADHVVMQNPCMAEEAERTAGDSMTLIAKYRLQPPSARQALGILFSSLRRAVKRRLRLPARD